MVDYEVSQPLRPIDFLEPGEGHPAIPNEFPDVDEKDPDFVPNKENSLASSLAKAFARNTQLLNAFQRIFHEQYILALRERHETGYPAGASMPKVGDVVLIHEAEKPQMQWRLGIIEELLPGRDLLHRSAMVRVRNPETKSNYLLKRAAISLYPLEHCSRVRARSEAPSSDSGSETSSNEDHRDDPEDRQSYSDEGNDFGPSLRGRVTPTDRPPCNTTAPAPYLHAPPVSFSIPSNTRPQRATKAPSRLDDYHLYTANNIF
jgi:hypothetical protein